MEYIVLPLVAFGASLLTFFSGFGLGTLLTPVFIVFFPVDVAIALTGVVHFANNIFKVVLVGKNTDVRVLVHFGVPAVLAALAGAYLMLHITDWNIGFNYELFGNTKEITPLKAIISFLLIFFALFDLIPKLKKLEFSKKLLPLGGLLSGFFGGLSGHQGALRSAFLIKAGLNKEVFVGTAVVIACFIDFTRLGVYATRFLDADLYDNVSLVIITTLAAIAGAYFGKKLLKKVTIDFIQTLVGIMLIVISLALGFGLI